MLRPILLVALGVAAGVPGCRDDPERPAAAGPATPGPAAAAARAEAETDLPAGMPEPLEIELRRRTGGDDSVLKLTPVVARYGLARGKARLAVRYVLTPETLDPIYRVLRSASFDRIDTVPTPDATIDGSSLRVLAGSARYAVSTIGRLSPAPEHAEAYARCVAAAESLLPRERSGTKVEVRWDPAVVDAAAIDLDLGEDLVGLHAPAAERPDVDLYVARPRAITARLRHGSPARSTSLTIQAGTDAGLEVAFDPERGAPVLRARAR